MRWACGEQAQGPFLLEVKRPRASQPARALAEIGYSGAHRGLGEDPEPERESRRADIEAPLEREAGRHRVNIALGELPMAAVPGLDGRQQPEGLAVTKHSG